MHVWLSATLSNCLDVLLGRGYRPVGESWQGTSVKVEGVVKISRIGMMGSEGLKASRGLMFL